MLEFLGLEDEAVRVLWGCVLIGIALGIEIGVQAGSGKKSDSDEEAKASVGQIIFLVFCILIGAVGLLMGIIPGILLFFTFQWKYLIGAIFAGVITVIATYFLARAVTLNGRRAKYMRNPIIREAAEFCRQNNIVAIQCFPDGMRFFTVLAHPGYCKKDVHLEIKTTEDQWTQYKQDWKRPEAWAAYDHSAGCIKVLRFAERNYPNVPDLPMFASALAKKLGGFTYAQHSHKVQYDSVSFSVNTKTTTHNIAILHEDCFVYSIKAYREAVREWDRRGIAIEPKPEKPAVPQKTNTWE